MININRHNYEEFFLLYTDQELSPADRMAVEQFVRENPDLADELYALQQATLPIDDLLTIDKSALYRNAGEEIGLHNHTELFLLYVDNELSSAEREKVETFVLQHPALQETFMQLKQTVLPQEQILFPDKSSLYKNESEKRPVVYMRWMRMVAAAAVIGFGFFFWTISERTATVSTPNQELAAVTESKNNNRNTTNNPKLITESVSTEKENNTGSVHTGVAAEQHTIQSLQQSVAINTPVLNTREESKIVPELVIERQNTITTEEPVKNTMDAKAFTGISANAAINQNDLIKTTGIPDANESTGKDPMVQQVVYKELDTETDSDNKSLFIGSVEINKDKLRGFFRKAGSLFRSRKAEEANTNNTVPTRSLK